MRVVLVVAGSGGHAAAVTEAVRRQHPDARIVAVWAGDPHLRPAPPPGAPWIDAGLTEPTGVGWGLLAVSLTPAAYQLARGLRAVAAEHTIEPTVMLRVGSAVVVGSLDAFCVESGWGLAPRASIAPPLDGLRPGADDLAAAGRYGTAIIAVGGGPAGDVHAIADAVTAAGFASSGGAELDAAIRASGVAVSEVDRASCVGWGAVTADLGTSVTLLDVDSLDPGERSMVAIGAGPPRVRLSGLPRLREALDRAADQWVGAVDAIRLPGAVPIDATMRRVTSEAIAGWRRGAGELPPDPFGESGPGYLEWLETPWPPWGADVGRYWTALHAERRDLAIAFPQPEGADHDAFTQWAANRWRHEPWAPFVRPVARPMRAAWHDAGRQPGGINLVGYLRFDSSLGDVARRIHASLTAAGVPVAALDYHRSGSPPAPDAPELTDTLRYDTNLVVVNADQLPLLASDHGAELFPGRHTIGYWFWDVEYVPPHVSAAARHLDELWVATPFTAAALGRVVDVPVRVMEIPVPDPRASLGEAETEREPDPELVPDRDPPSRFTFLTTFDHLSVTERKNPIGAIEAFRRAFPSPVEGGPRLIVKSLNAAHRWVDHERVRLAATGRPDIAVVDRHLSRQRQLRLIAAADCLVALHRSEGLGLHLLEAMWLGTPVITTRYSGNLHVMDDRCAALVDADLVPVARGEGYFPEQALWADPDLDQAATWMRRMVHEPDLGARLAAAGRVRMLGQPGPAETGRRIAQVARNRGGR